jgi:hypothetical protein
MPEKRRSMPEKRGVRPAESKAAIPAGRSHKHQSTSRLEHPHDLDDHAPPHRKAMTNQPLTIDPPDICLMLRAHAEQLWLTSEVLPTVAQLECPGAVADEHTGAALAYLEVLWLDARRRAGETDAALRQLGDRRGDPDTVLYDKAHRYHAAVRRLRHATRARVLALTGVPDEAQAHEHAGS